jgi:hypothetical protein
MTFKTITLCGSLKFIKEFVDLQIKLERIGHVCLSVTAGEETLPPTEAEKKILDKVHYKKILLSDCIIVIDKGGYVGESTRGEIEFCELTNRTVYYYLSPDMKRVFGIEPPKE